MAEWQTVAKVGSVKPGSVVGVAAGNKRIALCNVNGEHYALDDLCTHEFERLSAGWLVDEDQIECPEHGATFDVRTGKVTALPATDPVATYPVRIQGDEIQVEI